MARRPGAASQSADAAGCRGRELARILGANLRAETRPARPAAAVWRRGTAVWLSGCWRTAEPGLTCRATVSWGAAKMARHRSGPGIATQCDTAAVQRRVLLH